MVMVRGGVERTKVGCERRMPRVGEKGKLQHKTAQGLFCHAHLSSLCRTAVARLVTQASSPSPRTQDHWHGPMSTLLACTHWHEKHSSSSPRHALPPSISRAHIPSDDSCSSLVVHINTVSCSPRLLFNACQAGSSDTRMNL
ncbi:hypothetical protein B0O80DRAFT_5666 [Mortierella sp. GBAus27b]|nr:hypothetical protein B0O80DRAFT_5666 [Mortierella sp. GBAus27b]